MRFMAGAVLSVVFLVGGWLSSLNAMINNTLWQYVISVAFMLSGLIGVWAASRLLQDKPLRLPFRIVIIFDDCEEHQRPFVE